MFFVTAVPKNKLADLVARLTPSEILIPDHWEAPTELASDAMLTARPDWAFGNKSAVELLKKQLEVASLEGFGVSEFGPQAIGAAGAILDYLQENQKASLGHFNHLQAFRQHQFVEIDSASWRSLEISLSLIHI